MTLLENVSVKKGETETPHKKFHGSDPRYTNNLHCFGEIAVIKSIIKPKDKIDYRGHKEIFLGYGEKHAGDVFRFLNMKTGRVLLSQDVQWMEHCYGE